MHEYLQEMRRTAMDKYDRDAILVGELPGTKPEELKKYVLSSRRELSMTFDFDMMVRKLPSPPARSGMANKDDRSLAVTTILTRLTSTRSRTWVRGTCSQT